MATLYSDYLANWRLGRRQAPNVFHGKMRVVHWLFAALPAGNIADVLVCGKMRKGERATGGREVHSALSSGGGTCTNSYGIYAVDADGQSVGAVSDVDRFLVATSFEAAGGNPIADTIAHFYGYEATADFFICCTNSVEANATAGVVSGHLTVVSD